MAQFSSYEQYMLELINLARLDPAAEAQRRGIDLNQGLAAGTISTASKQPLAGNDLLGTAAANHSLWMLATDTFSHTGANGSSPGARMTAAGYKFTGSWTWGENIVWRGTTGTIGMLDTVTREENSLFLSAGHRANLLNPNFREIGIGIETGEYNGYNAVMATQNFAKSGTLPFLTGVAYVDSDANRFYTPGEGRGGIRVDARLAGGATTAATTAAAGGYQAQLAAGTYEVTLSGTGLAKPLGATLAIGSENVKLDLIGHDAVASSASLTMGANLEDATLLGLANLSVTGNALNNVITGNGGANALNGGLGDDILVGGAGNDTLTGGGGSDTAFYAGLFADYAISTSGAITTVRDLKPTVAGNDGTDTLTGIGKLQFSDRLHTLGNAPAEPPPPTGNTLSGTAGNDTLTGKENVNDTINGLAGHDTLIGLSGNDTLRGDAGDDTLRGGVGNDRLEGGTGNDQLFGDAGNDILIGGAGNDRMTGGDGNDVFTLARGCHADIIHDFTAGADRLDLSAFGFGNMAGLTSSAKVTTAAANNTIWIDFGGGDRLTIFGLSKLAAENVTF